MTETEVGKRVAHLTTKQSMELACLFCRPAEIAGFMPPECAAALGVARLYVADAATAEELAAARQPAHKEYLHYTRTNGWGAEGQAASAAMSAMRGNVVGAYHGGLHASSKAASHFESAAMWVSTLALDKILQDFLSRERA